MSKFPIKVFTTGFMSAALLASVALNVCFWNGKLQNSDPHCQDFLTTLTKK